MYIFCSIKKIKKGKFDMNVNAMRQLYRSLDSDQGST